MDGDRREVAGGGQRIDGLRAACAAAWSHDGQVSAESVQAAIKSLGDAR
jgi:hypothetical protein